MLGLHIGTSGVSSLPDSLPSKQGYLALQRYFPAASTYPAQIVVEGDSAAVRAELAALQARLARDPRFGPGVVIPSTSEPLTLLSVPVRGDPASPAAVAAVRELRATDPPRRPRGQRRHFLVGGDSAADADYFAAVTNPTPVVLTLVLGLSFIVLMVAFRSLVVALVSILLNLLSVGAAYGLLTLVFVHGVRSERARIPAGQHDRSLGPAVPVLGPLRAFDGLPGVPDEPDQGVARPPRTAPARRSRPGSPRPRASSPGQR